MCHRRGLSPKRGNKQAQKMCRVYSMCYTVRLSILNEK